MDSTGVDRLVRPRGRRPRSGDLLIAAPSLFDPRFRRTVVFLLQHGDDGSAGVVINRRSQRSLEGGDLPDWVLSHALVLDGGPVATDSVLALAPTDATPPAARRALGPDLCVVDLDALTDEAVEGMRLFVGYAGWGEGQLDGEIARDDWLVVRGEVADVLQAQPEEIWAGVLRRQPNVTRLWSTMPASVTAN